VTADERDRIDALRRENAARLDRMEDKLLGALREHANEVRGSFREQNARLEKLEDDRDAREVRARARASWANRAKWLAGVAASIAVIVALIHTW
jgi:hypothetical protein